MSYWIIIASMKYACCIVWSTEFIHSASGLTTGKRAAIAAIHLAAFPLFAVVSAFSVMKRMSRNAFLVLARQRRSVDVWTDVCARRTFKNDPICCLLDGKLAPTPLVAIMISFCLRIAGNVKHKSVKNLQKIIHCQSWCTLLIFRRRSNW